jgi:hypothetical protein
MSAVATPMRALALLAALAAGPAAAQEWGLYLLCSGQVEANGRKTEAHLDLAMRRNNQQALVQRSNVAPVGERFKFDISPTYYSMVFKAPARGSVLYYDWIRGQLFVWDPDLKKLRTIRVSVNRQTAALEGEMLDGEQHQIGHFKMKCEAKNNDNVEEPKF